MFSHNYATINCKSSQIASDCSVRERVGKGSYIAQQIKIFCTLRIRLPQNIINFKSTWNWFSGV